MDIVARDRVRISGRAEAPVVVLAHGSGCDQNMRRPVVPPLERDVTAVTDDHVGAGGSDPAAWSRERYRGLTAYADDAREVCRALGRGPVGFAAHSVAAGAVAAFVTGLFAARSGGA